MSSRFMSIIRSPRLRDTRGEAILSRRAGTRSSNRLYSRSSHDSHTLPPISPLAPSPGRQLRPNAPPDPSDLALACPLLALCFRYDPMVGAVDMRGSVTAAEKMSRKMIAANEEAIRLKGPDEAKRLLAPGQSSTSDQYTKYWERQVARRGDGLSMKEVSRAAGLGMCLP